MRESITILIDPRWNLLRSLTCSKWLVNLPPDQEAVILLSLRIAAALGAI
jgi:hypothetical protein